MPFANRIPRFADARTPSAQPTLPGTDHRALLTAPSPMGADVLSPLADSRLMPPDTKTPPPDAALPPAVRVRDLHPGIWSRQTKNPDSRERKNITQSKVPGSKLQGSHRRQRITDSQVVERRPQGKKCVSHLESRDPHWKVCDRKAKHRHAHRREAV